MHVKDARQTLICPPRGNLLLQRTLWPLLWLPQWTRGSLWPPFPPDLPAHAPWIARPGQGSACRPPRQGSAGPAPESPSRERQELAGISALAPRMGTRRPTGWGGALTSAAVRAQEAQEAVASPGDAVAVTIAVAGTVIHRLCGRKERHSCNRGFFTPTEGPGIQPTHSSAFDTVT